MDLDAVLARHPALVLVDELAHRNAPGSRHERRWQDVMELLDAGIDVWTTVNIQHLESLNDVVMRITGVRVSETVPDGVLDRLHDIVLVDLPPRELIARLQQGKVYVPEQAAQALQAFFSPANLTALRELAMQKPPTASTAACAKPAPRAARQPAAAPRRAGGHRWRRPERIPGAGGAAHRRTPRCAVDGGDRAGPAPGRGDAARDRCAFALARRLGGDAELLHGSSIADALLDHAAHNGVSTLVLGRTRERPLARMFNRTLTQQLIQRGAHYEITIISTPQARARSRREGCCRRCAASATSRCRR
jgi:two-component system sensor histidine kinase KdpD